jgi:uncharacterized protein (TIGR02466 family)
MNPELQNLFYFPSSVSVLKKPKFLDVISDVANERLEEDRKLRPELDDVYPVRMTSNFFDDVRIAEFSQFIGQAAWDILTSQGYATDNMGVVFTEMWVQEHHKHSLMEQHVHGAGSQIIGFYFLNAPENCSKVLFHDPRPGKVQTNLPEKNPSQASFGSNVINFTPEPGLLMFANSWLPHSFGRHASDEPLLFVHFNLGVQFMQTLNLPNMNLSKAEII